MRFITLREIVNETLLITPRYDGQVVRFNGSETVTAALSPVRVMGTGTVEVSEGFWDQLTVVADQYYGQPFDGDSPDGDLERFSWTGPPQESPSLRQTRFTITRPESDEEYDARVMPLERFLHGVGVISSPIVAQEFHVGDSYGSIMEFTLGIEDPGVYGRTKAIEVSPTVPFIVQDEAYNLVTRPSATAGGAPIAVATNYSQNPSVEVNATDWGHSVLSTPGRAVLTSGRTTELAAEGAASFRVQLVADGVAPTLDTLAAGIYLEHTIDLTGVPRNRFDVRIWGAFLVAAGQATISQMNAHVQWLNASNVQVGSVASVGPDVPAGSYGGYNFSGSIVPPNNATITKAKIRIWFSFTYTASATPSLNADVRMYGDAAVFAIQ